VDVAKMTTADLKKVAAELKKKDDDKETAAALQAALKATQALKRDAVAMQDAIKKNPDL
jgi:hypothetical protein